MSFPGETFEGRVTFVLHELEMATRTAKVRIEAANPNHRIKHEMFADVEINAGEGEAARLVVPVSALIDSGNRQVVIVDRVDGRFEPRPVKVGLRGDGYVEIAEGIKVGENVVFAANLLIDAESNLKAALFDAVLVPHAHALADEGMAQIVDAGSGMAAPRRPAEFLAQSIEDPVNRPLVWGRALGGVGQEWSVLHHRHVVLAQGQILVQGPRGRRVQGNQPRLGELGLPHRQHTDIEIDIRAREPQGFRQTQSGCGD